MKTWIVTYHSEDGPIGARGMALMFFVNAKGRHEAYPWFVMAATEGEAREKMQAGWDAPAVKGSSVRDRVVKERDARAEIAEKTGSDTALILAPPLLPSLEIDDLL